MSQSEMMPMEGEIQEEEILSSPKTTTPSKNKPKINFNYQLFLEKILKIIKSTKLKTVFILFIAFIVISIGLIVISSKKGSPTDTLPGVIVTTPQPQNVIVNPQTKDIEDKLDIYDNKVNSLGNDINRYQPPQIDLNVSF